MKIAVSSVQLLSIGLLAKNSTILAATCGNGNRGDGICANSMCCSQWGWCGTTSEYCSGGGTVPSPSPPTSLFGDWVFCSSSSQCLNKCCSKEYSTSDGKYKCTPGGKQCLSSPPPPTPPSTGGGSSLLGDWAFCSTNSQCQNNCCSKEYSTSDGKYKCTPGGSKCTGSSGIPPSPSPPAPPSTGGTSLYKGSGGGTYYYDVFGKFCAQDGGPYAENQGFPQCTSHDPSFWKKLQDYGTNNIVAIDRTLLSTEEGRKRYCGKEIKVYKDGTQVSGGPFVVFDGCEACEGGKRIDFSLSALDAIDNGNACRDGVVPGISWDVIDKQIINFVA